MANLSNRMEIAEAMQRSANVAQQSGLSLTELASIITIISSTTRRSADTIGEALKTIASRANSVRAGAEFDSMGESVNNVEKVLNKYKISLRDTLKEFRPLGEVLNDISGKWQTLSTVEKSQIAEAMAGTRQRNVFLAMMEHYNEVIKAQGIAANSAGLAQERYQKYLDSVEASANKLTDAMNKFWMKSFSADAIKGITDATRKLVEFSTAAGGLKPVVMGLAGAFILLDFSSVSSAIATVIGTFLSLKNAVTAAKVAVTEYGLVQATVNGVMSLGTGGVIALVAGIGLLVAAIASAISAANSAEQKLNTIKNRLDEINSKISELNSNISENSEDVKALEELGDAYKKAFAGSDEWYDIQNKIKEIAPEINGYYDEQGNFLINNIEQLPKIIDLKNQEIEAEQKLLQIQKEKQVEETKAQLLTLENEMKRLETEQKILQARKDALSSIKGSAMIPSMAGDLKRLDEITGAMSETQAQINKTRAELELLEMGVNNYSNAAQSAISPTEGLTGALTNAGEAASAAKDKISMMVNMIRQQKEAEIEALQDEIDAQEEYTKDKIESIEDIADAQVDALKKEEDAYEKDIKAKKEALEEETDNATDALNDQLDAYEENLDAERDLLEKQTEAQVESLNDQLDAYKKNLDDKREALENSTQDAIDKLNEQKETYVNNLDEEIDALKEKTEIETDALNEQLDTYKKIIDAQIESLNNQKEERDYAKEIAEKNKDISDIENQLLELQFDDSQEAAAKRLELEAEKAAAISDLEDTQYEHSVDSQTSALEKEYSAFEESIKDKITVLEDYRDTRVKLLEDEKEAYEENIADQIEILEDAQDKQEEIWDDEEAAYEESIENQIEVLEDAQTKKEETWEAEEKSYKKSIEGQIEALKDAQDIQEGIWDDELEIYKANIDDQITKINERKDADIAGLEAELEKFKSTKNTKIEELRDYLEQSGTLTRDAITALATQGDTLYQNLIDWNEKYGTGLQSDVIDKWDIAIAKIKEYAAEVANTASAGYIDAGFGGGGSTSSGGTSTAGTGNTSGTGAPNAGSFGGSAGSNPGTSGGNPSDTYYYDPISGKMYVWNPMANAWYEYDQIYYDQNTQISYQWDDTDQQWRAIGIYDEGGFSKNSTMKFDAEHEFASILTDELMVTPKQLTNFVSNILPQMITTANENNGNVTFGDFVFQVTGNLDKTVLPDIKNIVFDVVNSALKNRGWKANATTYAI